MMPSFDEIMKFDMGNIIVYNALLELLKKEGEILPFVGAGISAFVYQTWRSLLLEIAENMASEDKSVIINAIEKGDYYKAADFLNDKLGNNMFYSMLGKVYSEDKIDDEVLKKNAAFLIPKFCRGNCITTNYDRVLEHACVLNGIIPDKALPNNTNQLNVYLRNRNQRSALIFKIHGDVLSDREDIVLTGKSYDIHYGEGKPLRNQLIKWIDSRKLLFLGASLKQDKTVEIIRERMEQGMYNYAIYGCEKKEIYKLKQHFESLNILPIFYDINNHNSLRVVLSELLHGGLNIK